MRQTMNTFLVSVLCLVFLSTAVYGQQDDIGKLVQLPIAVDKVLEAGVNPRHVSEFVSAMRAGNVNGADASALLRQSYYLQSDLGGVGEVARVAQQQVDQGLTGSELAQALRQEIQGRTNPESAGAPANQTVSPDPEDEVYIRQEVSQAGSDRAPNLPNSGPPVQPPAPGNGNGGSTPPPGNGGGGTSPPGNGGGGSTPPPGNGGGGTTTPPGNGGGGGDPVTPPVDPPGPPQPSDNIFPPGLWPGTIAHGKVPSRVIDVVPKGGSGQPGPPGPPDTVGGPNQKPNPGKK